MNAFVEGGPAIKIAIQSHADVNRTRDDGGTFMRLNLISFAAGVNDNLPWQRAHILFGRRSRGEEIGRHAESAGINGFGRRW